MFKGFELPVKLGIAHVTFEVGLVCENDMAVSIVQIVAYEGAAFVQIVGVNASVDAIARISGCVHDDAVR